MNANKTSVKKSSYDYDIAIVGGGMVGLTLAQLLVSTLTGIRVILIERQPLPTQTTQPLQPSFDGRATALSATTVELFEDVGLWSTISQQATPISRVHISDRTHIGMCTFSKEENGNRELGYVVNNAWLGQSLIRGLDRAECMSLMAPAQVLQAQPLADGMQLSINDENGKQHIYRVDLMILADGSKSALAKQLGIEPFQYDYQQHALVTTVEFEKPHRGVAYERFTDEGPLALLPSGGNTNAKVSALVWTHPGDRVDATLALSDSEFLLKLQRRFGYRLGKFIGVGQRASYPLSLHLAREQVRSSLVLMGNAAHFLHPVAGQGFNLAVRDCAQLVSTLQAALSQSQRLGTLAVLNQYRIDRDRDTFLTKELSHNFNRLFSNKHLPLIIGRNLGLLSLAFLPKLRRRFFYQMMGRGYDRAKISIMQANT